MCVFYVGLVPPAGYRQWSEPYGVPKTEVFRHASFLYRTTRRISYHVSQPDKIYIYITLINKA